VYHESLAGGLTTGEHVENAKASVAGTNLAAVWGGARSEGQQRLDWGAAGLKVLEPMVWEVEAGIKRVYSLLKARRLYIFSTCKGLLDEFGTYRRKLDEEAQTTEKIDEKRKYHHLDALRYLAVGVTQPRPGSPAVGGERQQMLI